MFFFLHCKINLWLLTCLIKDQIHPYLLAVGASTEVYIFQLIFVCESIPITYRSAVSTINGQKKPSAYHLPPLFNPLNPKIKIKILICRLYSFTIEVVERS